MAEEMKKNMETENNENANQTPEQETHEEERVSFLDKVKTFGKEKVVPAAKIVGKTAKNVCTIAGGIVLGSFALGVIAGASGDDDDDDDDQEEDKKEDKEASESEDENDDQESTEETAD